MANPEYSQFVRKHTAYITDDMIDEVQRLLHVKFDPPLRLESDESIKISYYENEAKAAPCNQCYKRKTCQVGCVDFQVYVEKGRVPRQIKSKVA